jgi:triosephosphate isomerase
VINKKIKAALGAGIIPVLLVGERNRGDDRKQILEQQLAADLVGLSANEVSRALFTYEPVWAISTQPDAEPDTSENALEAIDLIRNFLTSTYNLAPSTYLYGGSVNSKNVASFLQHLEISGAVIGGASLRKDEFAEILEIVDNIK